MGRGDELPSHLEDGECGVCMCMCVTVCESVECDVCVCVCVCVRARKNEWSVYVMCVHMCICESGGVVCMLCVGGSMGRRQ